MTIVAQFSWDDIASADFGNPARKAFREAVEVVASHARQKLPAAVNGRIEAACKIVLQGDVELLPDDKAKVEVKRMGPPRIILSMGRAIVATLKKLPSTGVNIGSLSAFTNVPPLSPSSNWKHP